MADSLLENFQREDLTVMERAEAIKTLQTANLDENHPTDLMDEAVYMRDTVMTAMNEVRGFVEGGLQNISVGSPVRRSATSSAA